MSQGGFVLTTGGTGGHLFPAQALAERLVARGHRVAVITDARGARFSNRFAGASVYTIRAASPAGGFSAKARAVLALTRGTMHARQLLKSLAPRAVIGFGGYASFPTMWSAQRIGLRTVLHEQNAWLGRANRVMSRRATALALSFPETGAVPPELLERAEVVGNPVRAAVAAVRGVPYQPPEPGRPIRLLVFGGSQGARIFADAVPPALAGMASSLRRRLQVTQQTRSEDLERVRAAYAEAGIEADLAPFYADMPALLAAAHLVVARAGASTVAELAVAGRPAVLVPYPAAADDHQTANARAMVKAGGAWLVPDDRFDAATCRRTLEALLDDPAALQEMAEGAKSAGQPEAADRLADLAERVAGLNGGETSGRAAA